jgi:hypothetical protein
MSVGAAVGATVGAYVSPGTKVGAAVGTAVGEAVGAAVGKRKVVLVSVVELRVLVLVAEVDVKEEGVETEVLLTDVVTPGAVVGAAVGAAVGDAVGSGVSATTVGGSTDCTNICRLMLFLCISLWTIENSMTELTAAREFLTSM